MLTETVKIIHEPCPSCDRAYLTLATGRSELFLGTIRELPDLKSCSACKWEKIDEARREVTL